MEQKTFSKFLVTELIDKYKRIREPESSFSYP